MFVKLLTSDLYLSFVPLIHGKAVRYDSVLTNLKYCVQQLLHEELATDLGSRLLSSLSVRDIWLVDI